MSGTVTVASVWQQNGSNSGAGTIDCGDIAAVSGSGRGLVVLVVSVAGGSGGTGAPVISSVGVGADTTLKPSGAIGAFTQQYQQSFSTGLGGTVACFTAIASKAFSGLDIKFNLDRASQDINFAIYFIQGQIEPTTFTVNTAASGVSGTPSVTATSLSGNCIQIGVAQGSGTVAAPTAGNGFTTDSSEGPTGTAGSSAIGHKINSTGASPNTFSLGSTYSGWAAGIMSFNTGAAEGTIATNLTKAKLALNGLLNAEIGQITTNLTKASMALVGKTGNEAVITTRLRGISQSASGTVHLKESGTIATNLSRLSMSVQGYMEPKGTIITTLSPLSQRLTAFESQNWGTISTNLPAGFAQTVHGAVANIVAHVVTHLPAGIAQQAQGHLVNVGAINMTLANKVGIAIQARAVEIFTGHIVTNLPAGIAQRLLAQEIEEGIIAMNLPAGFKQSLGGEVFLEAKITTHLGNANVLVTTTVHAAQIIKGPIVTNLGQLQVHALGGLLGTPGDGPWYSWRYTDS